MAERARQPLPVSFSTDNPSLLKSELERFARTVQEQLDSNARDDVRPLGGDEPLAAGGVYRVRPGSRPFDRALPNLGSDNAGETITLIREEVGTASVYAISPATVSGKSIDYLPPRIGAYQLRWSGDSWYWETAPGLTVRHGCGASELRGAFGEASLQVSGSATLISDSLRAGVLVRGFGAMSHDSVVTEFYVPTGTQGDLKLRSYFRAQSGPTGGAMLVHRRLHFREYAQGTGVPSGFTVYTLPSITMPSGSAHWRYREDTVPMKALQLKGGRVQVVFSRPSAFPYQAGDLPCMLLVESITLEIDE